MLGKIPFNDLYNDLEPGWYLVYYRMDNKTIHFENLVARDYKSAKEEMKPAWKMVRNESKRNPTLLWVPETKQEIK